MPDFIYCNGETALGATRLCRYKETYVIANYVISVKKCTTAELAETTRFLSYSEVYVISGLVISRDDLHLELCVMRTRGRFTSCGELCHLENYIMQTMLRIVHA